VKILFLLNFVVFLMHPEIVHAYVGPGLGVGTVVIVLGFIGSIFLALFAVLWYPIKRLIKMIRGKTRREN